MDNLCKGQRDAAPCQLLPLEAPEVAALCKAAGDPLRIQILQLLVRDAFGVLELSRILDVRQPALSHHLKILVGTGLLTTRREGTFIYYRRALRSEDGLDGLRQQIFSSLDGSELNIGAAKRLSAEQSSRAERSLNFFHMNAEKFRDQQDLIAGYAQYGELILQVLDGMGVDQSASVLEIGPGEGELLEDLSSRFRRVVALDNSAEMLARSRAFVQRKGLKNIDFIHGDTVALASGALKNINLPVQVVTLNMVLHHTPSPGEIFKDIYPLLVDGGKLLLTELCGHDQDWARETCGDVWLGFEPETLEQWAVSAGFLGGESQYLALRNGFQIQVREFYK